MSTTTRHTVDISPSAVKKAEHVVIEAANLLKKRDFAPRPEVEKCLSCDVRSVCGAAKLK
jgi:DNA helicase-2/ATP-dependent DNA helicase PcrA